MSHTVILSRRGSSRARIAQRRMALVGLATILSLLVSLFPQVVGLPMDTASAHNLQTRMVYMTMDPATEAMLDARMAASTWNPPDALLQTGDELGLIIKVIPRDGTTTGVGGHVDFYVPNGVQVVDAAYLTPDGAGGFVRSAMKGQSPIAVGDGPIGAKVTTQLASWGVTLNSPNGLSQQPVTATGLHRGTIAGVYGDTGIFYSTDPDTAYGSWQQYTGDAASVGSCGSLAYHPTVTGKTITNNSGDTVVPCNKWDAEQLFAWGAAGTNYPGGTLSPSGTTKPVVDYNDGRGNAPWGFASGVAGPQSGYAWMFDWDEWKASPKTPADMQAAMDTMGPWQRIKYPGSRMSLDQPGLISAVLGYASKDASNLGRELIANPLPATVDQFDGTSPKAIRWAVGQLTAYRPEYVWVKVKVNDAHDITNASGCPVFRSDTFGGDAGGTDNGKDHLWRYYEPTEYTWNGCLAVSKPANREFVKVGETFQYKVKVYNLQGITLTNVKVTDTLGSGLTFVSAVPSQSSGPTPLQWIVGQLLPGQKFEATVTVKASGSGYLDNTVTVTSAELPAQGAGETVIAGSYPYLVPTKSVTPTALAPGGTVEYTILVKNVGTGPSSTPVLVDEYLPTGFTYDSSFAPVVTVNGAAVPGTTVNTTNPNTPSFSVPMAINGMNQMTIKFRAKVPTTAAAGEYCNTYRVTSSGVPITTGSAACVTVAGGQIGDTIWRDWDGDGTQDPGEEGLAGMTVNLYAADGTTLVATTTTDANGKYLFAGLVDATYVVKVNGGTTPTGYTQTFDPDGTVNNAHTVVLGLNQQYLNADFAYRPTGTGSIGDLVFEDKGNDGSYDAGLGDVGINGLTVNLYEDTNGNGVIDAGTDALVATATTGPDGAYSFPNLGTGYDYIVDVDQTGINTYFATTGWALTTAKDPWPVDNLSGPYTLADFGYYKLVPGAIGDQVFQDVNGDGVYTAGTDVPLAGIDVKLYRDTNGNGVVDAGEPLLETDTSDPLGVYGFSNLPAGNYVVVVDTADPDVPDGLLASKTQYATNLTVGEVDNSLDFPFAPLVQKTVNPTQANPGDTLTYQINVNYQGTTALENVVITDNVPAGTTYVPGSANAGGQLSVDGSAVVWNLGSGAPGIPGVTSPQGTALCYATKTYVGTADTYIDLGNDTNNYGTATEVRTRPANATSLKYSLFNFNLVADPIPAGAQIINADLKLTVTSTRGNHVDEVHRLLTPWTEAGATWNDSDGAGTGDWAAGTFGASDYHPTVLGSFAPATAGTKSVSVINTVKDWVFNGVPNYGFGLISTGTDAGDARYGSREHGTAASRPQLVVGYYFQSATACSGTVDLPSIADTYVQKDAPSTTAGTATTMWTNPANNDTLAVTNHSLVKFDLAPIPPGATINSTTLKIKVETDRDSDHQVAIHRMMTPWTETGASWSDANGSAAGDWLGGTFGSGDYASPALNSFIAIDAILYSTNIGTAVVNDWVNNGVANYGLLLRGTSTDDGDAKHGTRENTTPIDRPVLTVSWSQAASTNPQTIVTLTAKPLYRNGAGQIQVTMQVSSAGTITGVTAPTDLTVMPSGATVTKASGPTPAGPVTVSAGSPATFVYVYNVTPGALPGSVVFIGKPSLPASTFATATSETVVIAPVLTFKATVNPGTTLGSIRNVANFSSRASGAKLGPDLCYIVADGAPDTTALDQLVFMDPATGDYSEPVGGATGTGTYNVESLSWSPDGTKLYAVESGSLVTLDSNTGAYSVVGPIGPINGQYGTIFTPDVDSLTFDPASGALYAVARREDNPLTAGNTLVDVLFQINPATGLRIPNAFGQGFDYKPITSDVGLPAALYDIDGISFDKTTGILYGIANDPAANIGLGDRLVTINKTTGAVTNIGLLTDAVDGATAVTDMEGLSYLEGVGLIGTTGDASTTLTQRSSLFVIQTEAIGGLVMAELITETPSSLYVDWEAVACKLGATELGAYIVPPTESNQAVTTIKASIGDRVWADLDGDGVQDAGEPGLSGLTVKLYDSTGTTLLGSAVTDATGAYHFYDLNAGTYKVTYDLASAPDGYQPTTVTNLTVNLAQGQQYTMADFGLEPPGTASIGDTVWLDANENGLVDGAETGLPGVTVRLYVDLDNDGVLDPTDVLAETTTTDANGNYLFDGLQDGKFIVQVDTTSPVTSPYDGTTTLGTAMDLVSGVNPRPVTLADGQPYTQADFGFNWGGSIGDYVWMDNNRNGAPDGGETPIGGAAVLLYFDANNNGILDPAAGDYQIGYAPTNASGFYLFDNLAPGNYLVDVYEDSITTDGSRDIVPTTPNVEYVPLSPNEDDLTADFGYYEGALVQGNVFWDADRNAIFDESETGLDPVTVTLTGKDQFGNAVSMTTETDANGHYSFVVPVGTYTVTYDPLDIAAIDPALGETTTPASYTFDAVGGDDWHPSFDFGVDNSGKIGDRVWNDGSGSSGNGLQEAGESGIGGVTVSLYADTNNDGIYSAGDKFMAATATDPTGAYLFTGLDDGKYFTIVDPATLPSGYVQTGDPDATVDNLGTATIVGGNGVLTQDFGYRYTVGGASLVELRGTVWNDANGDGSIDPGETPIVGTTLTIDCGPGFVFVTQTTAPGPGGNWSVVGAPANTLCTVTVDKDTLGSPAFVQTEDPDSTLDSTTIVYSGSSGASQIDFGYRELLGTISGAVCEGNGNGLCDGTTGEPGLVTTVTLIYAGPDGILGTTDDTSTPTTTAANGDYSFPNLVPGLYQVVETNPANHTSLADADGGNPDNITVQLPLGGTVTDRDFEDQFVDVGFIGDLVWWDKDADGIQDAGELGIEGVTVQLFKAGSATPIQTDVTDVGGLYSFTDLPAGDYEVRILSGEFVSGGTLYNWLGSPKGQGADGSLDSDGDPTTHIAPVTIASGEGTTHIDFGFTIASSFTITKELTSPSPARLGEEVTFEITIVNTGDTWISLLPLEDSYNSTYLTYGFGSSFAVPGTVDNINDGVLNWTDLTSAAPGGWGDDYLAPGALRTVKVSFTARLDTTPLAPTGVVNTVEVENAMADPDGPGPLPAQIELQPKTSSDAVNIYTPTGITLEWFDAAQKDGGVLVNWRTASEGEILGFSVLRRAAGAEEFELVSGDLILAQYAGQEQGSVYLFRDQDVLPGTYTYRLDGVRLDGTSESYGFVDVVVRP